MIVSASTNRGKFWALVGILVFFLLNYPWLQIFNRDTLVGGFPILGLYLFGVWMLAIAALYALSRLFSPPAEPSQKKSPGNAQ